MAREDNDNYENERDRDIENDVKEMFSQTYNQPLLTKRTNTTSQIAIVGANVCPIESLDYEIVENELFKQDWRSRKKIQIFQYVLLKWAFALLIGLFTGLVGFFNNIAVENIAGFKLLLTTKLLEKNLSSLYKSTAKNRSLHVKGIIINLTFSFNTILNGVFVEPLYMLK